MKKIIFSLASILSIAFLSLFFSACENNSESTDTSKIMVRLTDAPGDYEEVNIEVIDVMMKANTDLDDSRGWVSLGDIGRGTYNLLDFTGGVSLLIAEDNVPSGYLGQLRLVLGTNNTIKKNGEIYPLKTPSAQQSGLKLKINETLIPGVTYEFMMDFNVDKSIVKAGNSGKYNLHPVITISTTATSGIIKGAIDPVLEGYQVMASVEVGTETISAYANEQGMFQLYGIPAGTYTVTLTPEVASGKEIKTVSDVVVTNGITTDIGNIAL
ncbi:DUF4382 domain-containing protein [Flavobacterium faecale]|uniref:DUF4382 domain-containing protein n=1 Tax=Flavobacterium faecale TaxID=1355330 RepID=UPI003AAFC6AE